MMMVVGRVAAVVKVAPRRVEIAVGRRASGRITGTGVGAPRLARVVAASARHGDDGCASEGHTTRVGGRTKQHGRTNEQTEGQANTKIGY